MYFTTYHVPELNGSMKHVVVCFHLTVIAALLAISGAVTAGIVKQSTSGLCHPPESSWYDRTQNFTPFDTVEACLGAKGRLLRGISIQARGEAKKPVGEPSGAQGDYRRPAFGHGWDDANGDCRNSRAEALVASSTTKVRFASDRGCQVVNGRWVSAFTAYSRPRLPLIPDEVCHPFHAKAATNSTAKLPPQQTA